MFNIDIGHMILLGIIALIFIGPKQLPEVARTIGRLISELKRASDEVTGSFLTAREKMDQAARQTQDQVRDSVTGSDQEAKPASDQKTVPASGDPAVVPSAQASDKNSSDKKNGVSES